MVSCGANSSSSEKRNNATATKPNILIIIADDLGWNDIGYHGSEIKTPAIDSLVQAGVQLNKYYVCSVSSPTRAALMTGRFPSRFNILAPLGDPAAFPQGTPTIASILKSNGYDTGISGKWHLGTVSEARPLNFGFNSSYGYLRGQIDPYTHLYKTGDRTWHRNDVLFDEEGHATDLITNEAVRFINQPRENKPFFLYVAYSVPHYPLEEPEEWTGLYTNSIQNESRRKFAASVSHMDNSIHKIINTLKNKGILENTLIFFQSDNGGQKSWNSSEKEYGGKFKSNDVLGSNLPLRDWKGSLYDGALRVPALMVWPGKIKPQIINSPLHVTDLIPTFAYITGARLPENIEFDGINFWPAIEGKSIDGNRIMYWRTHRDMAVQRGNWKLVHHGGTPGSGNNELYDLSTDPYETTDVAAGNASLVKELQKVLLDEYNKEQ